MSASLDTLKDYCNENKRVCPMPIPWNELFKMLKNKTSTEPSLPLILAAWWEAVAMSKKLRFFEHLEWADRHGQLEEISEFLYGLPEKDWFHFGD